MLQAYKTYIAQITDEVITWRRHIHENPELGFKEYNTADFIEKTLKDIGIKDVKRIGETGVLATITADKAGRCIALRADIDALPSEETSGLPFASKQENVAHICGHDIHTSVLLGTAKTLWQHKNNFAGTVKLIFQPAEEILQGSAQMIEAGVMENPQVDEIFGLHCWPDLPAGKVGLYKGAMMASANNFSLKIIGKQGHGAHPHRSVDPIVMSAQIITALQTIVAREVAPIEPAVLTIGKIHGGSSPNTIPEVVEIEGTFRTLSPAVAKTIANGISRITTGIASDLRGSAEVSISDGLDPLINDDQLYQELEDYFLNTFGKENVVQLKTPSMGSEDFSNYLKKAPGCFFRLGTSPIGNTENPPLHAKDFYADETSIPVGILAMTMIVQNKLGN